MSRNVPIDNRSRYRPPFGLLRAVVLIVSVVGGGTVGYTLLEGWNVLDSLYMTIITMTTVGYGEISPLSEGGRVFTIALIITSIGLAGYAVSTLAAFVVEGEFYRIIRERRMDQRITHLSEHVIVCGGGRTGKYIVEEFHRTRTLFVLIEQSLDVIEHVQQQIGDFPYLVADATDDDTLRLAGIDRARGLVAALGEDKDNVFIVLSARALNARLRIIARVNDEDNMSKLHKAGANELVSPNAIGGLRMASIMLRPVVVAFLDEMLRVSDQPLRIEEVHVDKVPNLIGKTLVDADIGRRTGMLVMAVRNRDGRHQFNPGARTVLQQGDILIVVGTPEQLEALHRSEFV
ncbi:MAG: potassium channel protein [Chloroflexi bacterium]|nr:potassium channel protein [Chloroflexota bacterium]